MPRAGLTPEVVAAEASQVCDEQGFDALSLAAVAKRLGVATPSLYKHVAGLDALRRLVVLATVEELTERMREAAVGRSRGAAVRALFAAYRDFAHEHPGRYAALQRAPSPEDHEASATFARALEVISSVLRGFAIPEERSVHVIRVLRSTMHGFIDLETQGGFGLPESLDESYTLMVEGFVRLLEQWPDTKET
ncbi:TetR/AcrR family transcriptional regulator [Nocardiopsis sp. MG754419]|uniref:TetR/AcrR family transcriptional regulator n=1 Tax=Nocardiopsis sp. MG754419 TaxID=2259865 RepID=UPI001BA978DA|nr:TetR/AcrR family transcriptional regulator [Nocardiopsis sp. MG754419]MBR8744582.1 TetR/AcrR family transcriptional regulator [Nocardiopsis sp. MG754419]